MQQYNEWMKKILEEEFSFLNNNVIKLEKMPNGMHKMYKTLTNYTKVASNDSDAFNLNPINNNGNFVYKPSSILVIRYEVPDNLTEYKEFRTLMVSLVLDSINQIKITSGKSYTDLVVGTTYLNFRRPGHDFIFFRQVETGKLEFRGHSDFIHD